MRAPRPFLNGWMDVWVEHVQDGSAIVHDNFGNRFTVGLAAARSKGLAPQPGEHWWLNRDLGQYTFAMIDGPRCGPEIVDTFDCNGLFMLGI